MLCIQRPQQPSHGPGHLPRAHSFPNPTTVDISALLKTDDDDDERQTQTRPHIQRRRSSTPSSHHQTKAAIATSRPRQDSLTAPAPTTAASTPGSTTTTSTNQTLSSHSLKRQLSGAPLESSPAKKQSKWSADEDAKIIQLRGDGMKWEDISKHLPGRSAISCRLHYQNYLERRSEWDEDRKNKLARLYERFKADMWAKIAEEMTIPWRAAEAMHWQMGEQDMARRAGVTPFALSNIIVRNDGSTQSAGNSLHPSMPPGSIALSGRGGMGMGGMHVRHSSAAPRMVRRDSRDVGSVGAVGGGGQMLPSLAELTAGLPAYATSSLQHQQHQHGGTYGNGAGFEHRQGRPVGGVYQQQSPQQANRHQYQHPHHQHQVGGPVPGNGPEQRGR